MKGVKAPLGVGTRVRRVWDEGEAYQLREPSMPYEAYFGIKNDDIGPENYAFLKRLSWDIREIAWSDLDSGLDSSIHGPTSIQNDSEWTKVWVNTDSRILESIIMFDEYFDLRWSDTSCHSHPQLDLLLGLKCRIFSCFFIPWSIKSISLHSFLKMRIFVELSELWPSTERLGIG